MSIKFKNIQADDIFYYLPGRSVAEKGDIVTKHTVSKVAVNDNKLELYCNDFNQGNYPLFTYDIDELNTDSFFDKCGWYSTKTDGIKEMYNADIYSMIKYYEDQIVEVTERFTNNIETLKTQLM